MSGGIVTGAIADTNAVRPTQMPTDMSPNTTANAAAVPESARRGDTAISTPAASRASTAHGSQKPPITAASYTACTSPSASACRIGTACGAPPTSRSAKGRPRSTSRTRRASYTGSSRRLSTPSVDRSASARGSSSSTRVTCRWLRRRLAAHRSANCGEVTSRRAVFSIMLSSPATVGASSNPIPAAARGGSDPSWRVSNSSATRRDGSSCCTARSLSCAATKSCTCGSAARGRTWRRSGRSRPAARAPRRRRPRPAPAGARAPPVRGSRRSATSDAEPAGSRRPGQPRPCPFNSARSTCTTPSSALLGAP